MINKISKIFLATALIIGLMSIINVRKVSAAPAQCWAHSVVSNEVGECSKSTILADNYKTLLSAGTDKCFDVLYDTAGSPTVKEIDCSQPPFNKNVQMSTPKTVKNDCNTPNLTDQNCGIVKYLLIFINLLSAMVGVVVLAMIIIGGIQYSSAGDDPQKVAAAKSKIANAILALVSFFFMYSFLQWLVPGGIF